MTPSDKAEAERRYPSETYLYTGHLVAIRAAYIAGREDERAAREQQHAICPECLGERRIKGALCPRCHGSAQIHRSKLRDGEVAPFERVALAATADVKEAAELRYPSDGTAWPISYHELIPEQRAAFDAGARWAAERAALAASGTAAGVGEAEVNLDSIARRCARGVRECATDLQYGDLVDRIKEALQAASSPPPAPAGEIPCNGCGGTGKTLHDNDEIGPSYLLKNCMTCGGSGMTPAPASVDRKRLLQLARDESWRREYPTGVEDAKRKTFIAGAEFIIRALASETGPAEGER